MMTVFVCEESVMDSPETSELNKRLHFHMVWVEKNQKKDGERTHTIYIICPHKGLL